MFRLGFNPVPSAVPRWLAVREWCLQGSHEKPLPPAPCFHGVGGVPLGWTRRSERWVKTNYPERLGLLKDAQVDIWLDGRESTRDDETIRYEDWDAFWSEVRLTGFSVPCRRMRVGVTSERCGFMSGTVGKTPAGCNWVERNPGARCYRLTETRYWESRLKPNQIGPTLRVLYNKQKKSEPAPLDYLVPESWRATKVEFSCSSQRLDPGSEGPGEFSFKNYSFNDTAGFAARLLAV